MTQPPPYSTPSGAAPTYQGGSYEPARNNPGGRYTTPAAHPQSNFQTDNYIGALLLIHVHGVENVTTRLGAKDAARCTIDALAFAPNEDRRPREHIGDAMLWGAALVRLCRAALQDGTGVLLGRLALGEGKPGMNAPYVLLEPSPADIAIADGFLASDGHAPGAATPAAPAGQPYPPTQPPAAGYGAPGASPVPPGGQPAPYGPPAGYVPPPGQPWPGAPYPNYQPQGQPQQRNEPPF